MIRFLAIFVVLSCSAFTAQAAPSECAGLHKSLASMTTDLQGLVKKQSALAAQIQAHDDARIAAQQDLDMAAFDPSVGDSETLESKLFENREAALAKRAELDVVNTKLIALNDDRNAAVEAFNKNCVN